MRVAYSTKKSFLYSCWILLQEVKLPCMYSRQNVTGFDKTSLIHPSSFMTLKIITLCRIMSLVSNFDLLFHNAME